jgi:hypothetical protein
MMRIAPVNIPADPKPATARPMIRAVEVGAVPQTKEPISKIPKAIKNTHFKE